MIGREPSAVDTLWIRGGGRGGGIKSAITAAPCPRGGNAVPLGIRLRDR